MSSDYLIEQQLRNAAFWWKWQLFVSRSALLGLGLVLAALLVGLAMAGGWLTSGTWAAGCVVALVLAAAFGAVGVAVWTAETRKDRNWQAAAVEQSFEPLMDRLNTLVYLQGQHDPAAGAYREAIQKQTHQLLAEHRDACRFSWRRTGACLTALLVAAVGTTAFYGYFQPWRNLKAAEPAAVANAGDQESLAIPETDSAERNAAAAKENLPWGEVRISEPGRDLRITPLDIVPLQIEAAANRPIQRVDWTSSVNGQAPVVHPLPAPQDPRYSVYHEELLPEALGLKAWDVMSYFATATCEQDVAYQSEIYFLDVLPFREELESLPDPAYRALEQMTAMMQRHQEVVRQTARLEQLAADDRKERSAALAREQTDLADAAKHLSAELASQLDPAAAAPLAESLEQVEFWLEESKAALEKQDASEAQSSQHSALGELAEARRQTFAAARQRPEAFRGNDPLARSERSTGDDAEPAELELRVKELEEKQQKIDAAEESLAELQKKQDAIREQAPPDGGELPPRLARQQEEIRRELQRLMKEQPEELARELAAAQATDAASQPNDLESELSQRIEAETARQLEQMARGLEQARQQQQAEQAETLEEWLDQSIDQLAKLENQPDAPAAEEMQSAADNARKLLDELEQMAGQQAASQPKPTQPQSGESKPGECKLGQEATSEKLQQLRKMCEGMCQGGGGGAGGGQGQRQAAGGLKQGLQRMAQALSEDQKQAADQQADQQTDAALAEMQQRRESLQQGRKAVQDALLEQRTIERETNPQDRDAAPKMAERQQQLNQRLDETMRQNPSGFEGTPGECHGAKSAMGRAEQALQAGHGNARQLAGQAADSLQELDNALEKTQQRQAMADAYRLKKAIDEQAQRLGDLPSQAPGEQPGQGRQIAQRSKSAVEQLRQLSEQFGEQAGIGPKSQEALGDEQRQPLEQAADRLSESQTAEQSQQAAGELKPSLEKLSQAMAGDRPGMSQRPGTRQQQQQQGLQPSGQQAISQGLRNLESAARRQARSAPQSATQQLRSEAARNLAEGVEGEYGHNEQTDAFVNRLNRDLKEREFPVDMATVQKLLQEIQSLRREAAAVEDDSSKDEARVTNIDPAKLPADYRESIEKYFERLSEEK